MKLWVRTHPFLFVGLFALTSHLLFFWLAVPSRYYLMDGTDGSQYQTIANNLLAGRGFSLKLQEPYVPDTIRTPVYPLFLAATKKVTGDFPVSTYLTLLLGIVIPLSGAALAKLLDPRPRFVILVGCLLALDFHVFYYSFIYGSEGVFLPFVSAGLAFACYSLVTNKRWQAVLAGFLFGLATLARPIVQFIPLLFIFIALMHAFMQRARSRRLLELSLLFVGAYVLVVSPWLIRNVRTFGAFDYANIGWFNMYTRVAATTLAIDQGRDFDTLRLELLERMHELGYVDHTPVKEVDIQGYELNGVLQKETLRIIKEHPKAFLISQVSSASTVLMQDLNSLFLKKLGLVDYRYPSFAPFVELSKNGLVSTIKKTWDILSWPILLSIIMRFVWLFVFVLSLLALPLSWSKRRSIFPLVLFLVLYELGITALSLNAAAQSDARYRAQFIFAELPLALFAASLLFGKRSAQKNVAVICPVCGLRSFMEVKGKKGDYTISRCAFCEARVIDPMPTDEQLKAFYSESYFFGGTSHGGYMDYEADKVATKDSLHGFLAVLEREAAQKGTLLDIGAATGVFLEVARARGWNVAGNEMSEAAVSRAIKKGIAMTSGPVRPGLYPDASFDAVTMLDVIEHLPKPLEAMQEVSKWMRPYGLVLLNTPDSGSWFARMMRLRWHAYVPPEHVVIFREKTLRVLLDRSSFETVWVGKVPKTFRLSYILQTAARWTGLKYFFTLAAAFEKNPRWNWSIPLNLRDNLVVVGRKRV